MLNECVRWKGNIIALKVHTIKWNAPKWRVAENERESKKIDSVIRQGDCVKVED